MVAVATTRSEPGPEGRAALAHLLRALLLLAGVVAIGVFHDDLEQRGVELGMSTDQTTQIITTVAVLALVGAAVYGTLAAWRTYRWLRERRFERMLRDPERAALVPPRATHLAVRQRMPTAGTATRKGLFFAFLLLVGLAALVLLPEQEERSSDSDSGSTALHVLLLVGLLVAAIGYAGVQLRRWMRARRVERMSEDPAYGAGQAPELAAQRAATIPPLSVTFDRSSHASYAGLFPLTAERNVFGRPPWNIAYLRLFDNEARAHEFVDSAWRECGYVHFIRSATSVSADELDAADDGQAMFIDSVDWLLSAIRASPSDPLPSGRHEVTTIAGTAVKVADPYGSYPLRPFLCHGTFWKTAVDTLFGVVDVVILDLSGFLRANVGTGYELQRVIDRFPINRCVLLADPQSDRQFLEAQVRSAWSQMGAGSPNQGEAPRSVDIATTTSTRRDRRRDVAAMVQQRLDALRVAEHET